MASRSRTAATVDYAIDGQNRRVGKKVCGTAINVSCPAGAMVEGFLYRSQLQPAAWLNGDGTIKATFVYGLKPNVPEYMIKGVVTYRLVTDQVGSVRLVVDTAGNIAERIDYDEFGNVLSDSAPGLQPFGFAGGLLDRDAGLVRFGARDYDALTGRWVAKDPLRFGGGSANLYNYVAGDPINRLDPQGTKIIVDPELVPAFNNLLRVPALRPMLEEMESSSIVFRASAITLSPEQLANDRSSAFGDWLGSSDSPTFVNGVCRSANLNVYVNRHQDGEPLEETLAHEFGHAYNFTFEQAASGERTNNYVANEWDNIAAAFLFSRPAYARHNMPVAPVVH